MENFNISVETKKSINDFNQKIDKAIEFFIEIKRKASHVDIEHLNYCMDEIHKFFYKSNASKFENAAWQIYDNYTYDLEKFRDHNC